MCLIIRQPILFRFVLFEPAVFKVIVSLKHYTLKKVNKSVLKSITFCLEVDNHEENDFNGETLTFTLQMMKISTNK